MPYELKNSRDGQSDEELKKSLEKKISEITCLIEFIEDIKNVEEKKPETLVGKNPLLKRLEGKRDLINNLVIIKNYLEEPNFLDRIVGDSDPDHIVGNFLVPVIGILERIEKDNSDNNYSEIIEKVLEPKINDFLVHLESLKKAA